MSWVENLIEYKKSGNSGKCPKCGSAEISVQVLEIGRGSISFKCDKCGSSSHFDCATRQNSDK